MTSSLRLPVSKSELRTENRSDAFGLQPAPESTTLNEISSDPNIAEPETADCAMVKNGTLAENRIRLGDDRNSEGSDACVGTTTSGFEQQRHLAASKDKEVPSSSADSVTLTKFKKRSSEVRFSGLTKTVAFGIIQNPNKPGRPRRQWLLYCVNNGATLILTVYLRAAQDREQR